MALNAGTRLGPYEIVSPIGKGGMGEVYKAHDVKLGRDVAIKVLPDALAHDADRLQRFEREARTLAALNHTNIAHIYGLETVPSADAGAEAHALVMELVEGPTLADRIARGPVPSDEARAIARQIADGLEAAHEQGIVHRDLKPANVKVRDDGTVKILDFGLAKALAPETASASADVMNSPTLTAPGTAMGMILGTAAYMAPEQAKGRPVDRRADIWAFGVVLYEMLTGRRAFAGDDVSEVLASVIKGEPDWSALPAGTPASIQRVLRRCLEKDPRKRLRAIGDARLDLDLDETEPTPVTGGEGPATVPTARLSLVARIWPVVAAVLLTVAIGLFFWPSAPAPAHVSRLSVLPPPGVHMYPDSANMAISPDGRMVAFVEGDPGAWGPLWVRSLDTLDAHAVEGADKVLLPFWSPDGRRIGFFTPDKLETISVDGGRPQALCDAPDGRGGTWNADNVIVFAPDATGPLYRISANGGQPEPVTKLDTSRGESGHRSPLFLPDGERFLYAALPGHAGKFDMFVGSLGDASRTSVGQMESAPAYAAPGWLLFTREGVLAAQPFDLQSLKVTGEAVSLDDAPTTVLDPAFSDTAGRLVSVASDGTLAYFSSPSVDAEATWLDLAGTATGTLPLPPAPYRNVVVAPDGTHAVLVRAVSPSESSLWLTDLTRGGAVPLSTGQGQNTSAVWSPDSRRLVFASDRDGPQNFYLKTVGDPSPETLLYRSSVLFKNPDSWSSDGKWILCTQAAVSPSGVYVLPASGNRTPQRWVDSSRQDLGGVFSPDGHWAAYESDQTGRMELYVRSFPKPGLAVQVSMQGVGTGGPVPYWWTRDSRHLFFVGAAQRSLWRADLTPGQTLKVSGVTRVAPLPADILSIDMTPDRKRFLALLPEQSGAQSITIVQHWRAALTKGR